MFEIFLIIIVVFIFYLAILYLFQDKLIYKPSKKYISPTEIGFSNFKEEPFLSKDKTSIMAWYSKGDDDKPTILFFHGNGFQNSKFVQNLMPLVREGYSVAIMEYRGFGNTAGKMSQEKVIEDATFFFDKFKNKNGKQNIVFGYSLGTGVATALTNYRQVDKLILLAPFISMYQLACDYPLPFASWILKDKYHSDEYILKYKNPLLIIHGREDQIIPYKNGKALFEMALSEDKKLVSLEKEDHFSIFLEDKYVPAMLEWITSFSSLFLESFSRTSKSFF